AAPVRWRWRSDCWVSPVWGPVSRCGGSEASQHRDDLAVDRHVAGVELHRLEPRVGGLERDLAALAAGVGLDRRLVAGDPGDDHVALAGLGLLAGDDEV